MRDKTESETTSTAAWSALVYPDVVAFAHRSCVGGRNGVVVGAVADVPKWNEAVPQCVWQLRSELMVS